MPKTLQTTTKTRVSGKIAFVVIAVAVIIGAAYTASTLLPLTTSIETKVLMNNPILSNGAYSINLPVGVNTAYQDGWVCDGECPLKQKKWTDSDEAFAGYWSFSQPPLGPFSGSFKSFFDFDVTKIPDNATISSVVFNVWINRVSDPIKNKNIFYRMSGKGFNRTWMEIWNDMGGCSTYSNPSDWVSPNNDCYLMNNFFNSNVDKYVAVNLGSLAVSDLQRLTDQDKNYFSLGVRGLDSVNNPYSSLGVSESAHPPYLAVIYGIPALTLSQSVYSVDNLQGSAVLAVKNTGSGIMSWSAQESCDWLSLSA
ncbi:MAG TPA: hypothetical protein VJG65_01645, partial [Patescibacteria group bacterium]|nr:hypothetical protein [Patescibacteria group bacterium]